jgi:hypothetical protein
MVREALHQINKEIPEGVTLVAVSKFHPADAIREAYEAGQRVFGESRVQELLSKIEALPTDIQWHFIGHLQTNKVKQLVGKVRLIESVDSVKLLSLIDAESKKIGVCSRVLLQLHVAREETKFGFYPEELMEWMHSGYFRDLNNVSICGVMGMASNTDDEVRVRSDFKTIRTIFDNIKTIYGAELPEFKVVSMGMSHDWRMAVEEGSNMVRIGTAIFGER